MQGITKTVGFLGKEVQVSPIEGDIEDGELKVKSVLFQPLDSDGNVEDEEEVEFDTYVSWESMNGQVKEYLARQYVNQNGDEETSILEMDTSDRDWTEMRVLTDPRSDKQRKALKHIVEAAPCTSELLDEKMDGDASNQIYRLKEKDLIACIGYSSRHQVLVPTHVGWKEYLAMGSTSSLDDYTTTGIESLFDDEE